MSPTNSQLEAKRAGAEDVLDRIRVGGGQAFIVLHSTTGDEETSRIVPRLHPGAAVTTFKNIVDRVVTEYGVAVLRGSSIAERTRRLIDIAHPRHEARR